MEKVSRREMASHLNDYLVNWKFQQKQKRPIVDDRTFHLYYPKNKLKAISDQDYCGEKINRIDLERIDYFGPCDSFQWIRKKRKR